MENTFDFVPVMPCLHMYNGLMSVETFVEVTLYVIYDTSLGVISFNNVVLYIQYPLLNIFRQNQSVSPSDVIWIRDHLPVVISRYTKYTG